MKTIFEFESRYTDIISHGKIFKIVSDWISSFSNRDCFHHSRICKLATDKFPKYEICVIVQDLKLRFLMILNNFEARLEGP